MPSRRSQGWWIDLDDLWRRLQHELLDEVCSVLHRRDVLCACFVDGYVERLLEAHHNLNLQEKSWRCSSAAHFFSQLQTILIQRDYRIQWISTKFGEFWFTSDSSPIGKSQLLLHYTTDLVDCLLLSLVNKPENGDFSGRSSKRCYLHISRVSACRQSQK